MAKFWIPGQALPPREPDGSREPLAKVTEIAAFRMDSLRSDTREFVEQEVADDAIVELELEEGVRIWRRADTFAKQLQQENRERGHPRGKLVVPARLSVGETERGLGSLGVRVFRLLGVDPVAGAAEKLAELADANLVERPGLYRWEFGHGLDPAPLTSLDAGDEPLLIFVHGTLSRTIGSFGRLITEESGGHLSAPAQQLLDTYGERIFALEHHTVGVSPLQNALDLARVLPAGAEVHLVTHSRGGLVGEILCRSGIEGEPLAFDQLDLRIFRDEEHSRAADRKLLEQLNRLMAERQIRVGRFLRVACPARGTDLASRKLDIYLSLLANLATASFGPVGDVVRDFALAVIKERANPEKMPGIEAMVPTSPLIRTLNRPDIRVQADLSVIAGDVQGKGLAGGLKALIGNAFFWEDNDLVVNTRAMFGGAQRADGGRFYFHEGPRVDHFNYFVNQETRQQLLNGLLLDDRDAGAFKAYQPQVDESEETFYRRRALAVVDRDVVPRPMVVVLPGIMGSHLAVKSSSTGKENRIWLDLRDILIGNFDQLAIDADNVIPQEPVASAYARLVTYLGNRYQTMAFAYDWRKSLREEADRLAEVIGTAMEENPQPLRIIAHSMGGLLARVFVHRHPDLWQAMKARSGCRIIMLGTPNNGSYVIPRLLLGREQLLKQLALVDAEHSRWELLEYIARFPGILEMLPAEDESERNWFTAKAWQQLGKIDDSPWTAPTAAALAEARKVRRILDEPVPDPGHFRYVAGWAKETPAAVSEEGGKLRFVATNHGDGRVPWQTGKLNNVETWYMNTAHGDMADYERAFPALVELLEKGSTELLDQVPPAHTRGPERTHEIEEREPEIYPDLDDLVAASLGYTPPLPRATRTDYHPVSLKVFHGNLAWSRFPVAVGHYRGDTIISAESALDWLLDGRLRKLHRLGLYPGDANTAQVFLQDDVFPGGAIVIGLGYVGELTPGKLTESMVRGLLQYGNELAEAARDSASQDIIKAPVSSLFIGSSAGGLGISDSIAAVMRAVLRANGIFKESGVRVRIEQLNFLELYQDKAVAAIDSLRRICCNPEFERYFDLETLLQKVPGGQRRISFDDNVGWWRRLQILELPSGALKFTTLTDKARVEVSLQPTQRALVDGFIDNAISGLADSDTTAATLYELLFPNRLKSYSHNQESLVLVLDRHTAAYPWELLYNRRGFEDKPLSVQAGMVRQLRTERYREQVQMTTEARALVVGDPPSEFPPLPAAREEAQLVAGQLAHNDYKVVSEIGSHASSIIQTLLTSDYRILHLAGHGVYQYELPAETGDAGKQGDGSGLKVSGMVLGNNLFLTPTEINQMAQVPDLVFINCCHLGKIEDEDPDLVNQLRGSRHKLAANLATQLIEMGVKAVVAAGWAVGDQAAAEFAETFYSEMLDGERFGIAVQAARSRIFNNYPGDNTWGAYQCYGDPDYRLKEHSSSRRQDEGHQFVTLSQALVETNNIIQAANTASSERSVVLLEELQAIRESTPDAWLKDAAVCAAFARAYAELDNFEESLRWYQKSLLSNNATLNVREVENFANIEARLGLRSWLEGQDACMALKQSERKAALEKLKAKALEHINKAKARIYNLNVLGGTPHRYAILGSAHKREAYVLCEAYRQGDKSVTPDLIRASLRKMVSAYRVSHKKQLRHFDSVDAYPLINWLIGQTVLSLIDNKLPVDDDDLIERKRFPDCKSLKVLMQQTELTGEQEEAVAPTFWSGIIHPNCLLAKGLATGELADCQEEIISCYVTAKKRGASPRQLRTQRVDLDFIILMLDTKLSKTGGKKAQKREQLCQTLEELRSAYRQLQV